VPHAKRAKCAKRSRRFRISEPLFFSMQSLAPGVRWRRAHGSRRFVGPERLACGGSVMPQACLPVAGIGQTGFLA
jgi:hypothetical protein